MGRKPCSSGLGLGLNRGAWTPREDLLLKNYVQIHGEGNWSNLPMKAGLLRCGRSCRLRWMNYLRSGVKHDNISAEEEELILRLHKLLGNRWSLIAARVPGRTDNQIKNLWYSRLSKKAAKTATQHCNVIKPVPYKYILPSPSENTVGFKAEIIHQDGIDGSVSNFLFQPTNYKGNQTRGCVDGEELVTKLPDWPFPQYVHNMAKGVTLIEMNNSVVNPNEIQNTIDQGFWSPSSSVSTAYY